MTKPRFTANEILRVAMGALQLNPRILMSKQEEELEAYGYKFVRMREDTKFECCGECHTCEGPQVKPVYRYG